MKATLILIQNDADHAQAKALVDRLMTSESPAGHAKLAAQARLIEAYERERWPQKSPALADVLTYLLDQHDLNRAALAQVAQNRFGFANQFVAAGLKAQGLADSEVAI